MRKHRASKRYASALFELSLEEKAIDIVEENMIMIGDTFQENADLLNLFASPNVRKKEKEEIIDKLFKSRVHSTVYYLLQLLLKKNRELLIVEIVEWFKGMVDEYRDIMRAELITPVPLDSKQKERIAALIEKKIGKKVVFVETVDAGIVGGFIIKTADKIFDASIKNELSRLSDLLVAAEFN